MITPINEREKSDLHQNIVQKQFQKGVQKLKKIGKLARLSEINKEEPQSIPDSYKKISEKVIKDLNIHHIKSTGSIKMNSQQILSA